MTIAQAVFLMIAIMTVAGALGTILSRQVIHAAFFLALAFLGVAGVYILLGAGFLGAVQVLIYVGAVTTMIVFAAMLSDIKEVDFSQSLSQWWQGFDRPPYRQFLWGLGRFLAPVTALGFLVIIGGIFWQQMALPAGAENLTAPATLKGLARAMFTTYALPFEVASVLLVAALVGAVVMARKEEK